MKEVGRVPLSDAPDNEVLDAVEAIAPRAMTHSGDPDDFVQAFISSPEFEKAMEMWDGPTDMAVEYLEYMMQNFEKRNNTMPSIDDMMSDGIGPLPPPKGDLGGMPSTKGYDEGVEGGYSDHEKADETLDSTDKATYRRAGSPAKVKGRLKKKERKVETYDDEDE